jgi:DNA-binding IclR family transcriptional regulator
MRRRILTLLRDHPEGLSPAEIRSGLRVAKQLHNTCLAMLRDGLLRRVGRGRYVRA